MGIGIVEIITLLLQLSGFSVHPNPKAMSADQALEYAMPDADVVAELDLASVVPGNYKLFTQLADQPQIKGSPALAKAVREGINEVEAMRGMTQTMSGLDITTDINDVTVFVRLTAGGEPSFLSVSHGKFTPAQITKIATTAHVQAIKVGGGMMIELGDKPAIGITKSGVMLGGAAALVRDRLADGWKAPSHAAGTNLGYAADIINAKPVFAVVMTMSKSPRDKLKDKVGENFIGDLITRHKAAAFVVYHDGIGWTWVDSTRAGFDAMTMVSDGMLDIMRAAQIAPRGIAKIVIGGLESYRGKNQQLDDVITHKDDILKLVNTYSGDGNFKVAQSKDAAGMKLVVRASGKTLSEVLPAGLLLPFAAIGFLVERGTANASPPTMAPALTPPHR